MVQSSTAVLHCLYYLSGATIGHRSLHKYYKQNINPRSGERTRSILPKMLAQYKALGWTGATGKEVITYNTKNQNTVELQWLETFGTMKMCSR